jgi:hypothetical protein
MENNKDKSAFPINRAHLGIELGLSKREYIAAMAMQGLLANYQSQVDMLNQPSYNGTNFDHVLAENSVAFADALLKELEK